MSTQRSFIYVFNTYLKIYVYSHFVSCVKHYGVSMYTLIVLSLHAFQDTKHAWKQKKILIDCNAHWINAVFNTKTNMHKTQAHGMIVSYGLFILVAILQAV